MVHLLSPLRGQPEGSRFHVSIGALRSLRRVLQLCGRSASTTEARSGIFEEQVLLVESIGENHLPTLCYT